jgi:hypothetical protein
VRLAREFEPFMKMAEGPFKFAVPLKQLAKRPCCLGKQPRLCESLGQT